MYGLPTGHEPADPGCPDDPASTRRLRQIDIEAAIAELGPDDEGEDDEDEEATRF